MIKNLVNSGIHANSIVFSPEGENLVGFKTKVMLKYGGFRGFCLEFWLTVKYLACGLSDGSIDI